jgi:hypothetical protein
MKIRFEVILVIFLAISFSDSAILMNNVASRSRKVPGNRKLIFSVDRDEEFKRKDDRERCSVIS